MTAGKLLNLLFNAGVVVSIAATVLSLGMSYRVFELLAPLRRVWLVVLMIVVNAVLVPAAAYGIGKGAADQLGCGRRHDTRRDWRCDRRWEADVQVDAVDQDLQHGGDDRRAAGRPDRQERVVGDAARSSVTCSSGGACRRPAGSGPALRPASA